MSALDEIVKKEIREMSEIEYCLYRASEINIHCHDSASIAAGELEEQAAELVKLREEIQTLKELLYEAQYINMLSDGEGGGAWSVNGDLEQRIDKALEGFEIAH